MSVPPVEPSLYVPHHFAMTDLTELHGCIRQIAVCTLITLGDELDASLVPVVLAEGGESAYGTLRGHLARPNAQLKRHCVERRALAVFHGPAHYITPAWYETKRRTGKVVPTYDYVMIQARGFLRTIDDRAQVRDHLTTLTAQHEATVQSDWRMSDAPDDFIDTMLSGITAFELPIDELVGKLKLSQNRPADDIDGVVAGLAELGTASACDVARLVQEHRPSSC